MNQVSTYDLSISKAISWMHHLTAADTQNKKGTYKQPEPLWLWRGGKWLVDTVVQRQF